VIAWTYFGYFVLLLLMSLFISKKVIRTNYYPPVSIIITAYNEEKRIGQKIVNTLELEYPKEKMEIIIVSDCCNDKTEQIIEKYVNDGVILVKLISRGGKGIAQLAGINAASHGILVFTDATTSLNQNSLKNIMLNFADASVGCVSGRDVITKEDKVSQCEGIYVKYEMQLRKYESVVNSLVGVSGSFFAIKREICDDWRNEFSSDYYLPIVAYMHGYRTIFDPQAINRYSILKTVKQEYTRKVRTIVLGLVVLLGNFSILNPFKYGFYAFQMFSHKLLRWLVPFFMLSLFLTNIMLTSKSVFWIGVLIAQVLLYFMALLSYLITPLQINSLCSICLFFVISNISIVEAWYKFLFGQKFIVWEPTKR
jgi:cellulose synthase/poly-beta-1,6-N-acetylglucosamine synthase-like glycosyltransferase